MKFLKQNQIHCPNRPQLFVGAYPNIADETAFNNQADSNGKKAKFSKKTIFFDINSLLELL